METRPRPLNRLQEKIAHLYYRHGLLCSSHPWLIIIFTLIVAGISIYPLLGVHFLLPGFSSTQQHLSTLSEFQYRLATSSSHHSHPPGISADSKHGKEDKISPLSPPPRWYQSEAPYAYVQQIIIKSAVIPWKQNLILMDAIRAPLAEIFPIVEFVSNHHTDAKAGISQSLNDFCLQVTEPSSVIDSTIASYLPQYSCLLISPANVWQNDLNKYLQDATIIKTLYSIKDIASLDSSGSLREVLFGLPWMETGIKRMYVRTRQRTITYSLTLLLNKYEKRFIDSLKQHLHQRYPTPPYASENLTESEKNPDNELVTHIYFHNQFTLSDFVPLGAAYFMLYIYVYFSLRKVDLVKSKWVLAASSVVTVLLSLLMAIGICLRFGFNPTLNLSQILPYIVIFVGLENILVLTKSVVSSPSHLDKKVRVAQGLSKEAWSITKNLIAMLSLLAFGFVTFVPIIQEFCIFAFVGLLSDFFLQIFFFAPVLAMDIQKFEINSYVGGKPNLKPLKPYDRRKKDDDYKGNSLRYPMNIFARPSQPIPFKLPKRLRFVYFWARTRMVQRALMLALIGWILFLVHKSGLIMSLLFGDTRASFDDSTVLTHDGSQIQVDSASSSFPSPSFNTADADVDRLIHRNYRKWKTLSAQHWSALFGYYNMSLTGRYISILPPIHLSIPVDASSALQTRHPAESDPQIFRQFLYHGVHPPKDPDVSDDPIAGDHHAPLFSSGEILLYLGLAIPTIMFIVYVIVMLYRCMCSRHYAEWRSSWSESLTFNKRQDILKYLSNQDEVNALLMTDMRPIHLDGHSQEIESIATCQESQLVATHCLYGDIKVWDSMSGECYTHIKRSNPVQLVKPQKAPFHKQHKPTGSFSSDSTYGSSPGAGSSDYQLDYASIENQSPVHYRRPRSAGSQNLSINAQSFDTQGGYDFSRFYATRDQSRSIISNIILHAALDSSDSPSSSSTETKANHIYESPLNYSPIWAFEILGSLIFVGCASGRLEIWEALSGTLLYSYNESDMGITNIKAVSVKLAVSRLNGALEIFNLETANGFDLRKFLNPSTPSPSSTPDAPSFSSSSVSHKDEINYKMVHLLKAHSQPITCLEIQGNHLITGSLDHVVKVFRLDTAQNVYTLHGHCGGITAIHVDQSTATSAISGCQVGQVCVWDLSTGTCVFSLEAHQDATVTSLLATPLYVVSAGTDNRVCIWDKYSGHLVHTINQNHTLCRDMIALTPNIIITAKDDHLIVWDISEGMPMRVILLDGTGDRQSFVKNLKISSPNRTAVCELGNQLCLIHFPTLTEKYD